VVDVLTTLDQSNVDAGIAKRRARISAQGWVVEALRDAVQAVQDELDINERTLRDEQCRLEEMIALIRKDHPHITIPEDPNA
jgi:DNA repair ATPase RecN